MKWMGWSLDQLESVPNEYRDEIIQMMIEEIEEYERSRPD